MKCLNVGEKPLGCTEVNVLQLELQIFKPNVPDRDFQCRSGFNDLNPSSVLQLTKLVKTKNMLGALHGVLLKPDLVLPNFLKLYLGLGERDSLLGGLFFSIEFF